MRISRNNIISYNNPDAGLPAAQYLPRIQDSLLLQNSLYWQLGFLAPTGLRGKLRSLEFIWR